MCVDEDVIRLLGEQRSTPTTADAATATGDAVPVRREPGVNNSTSVASQHTQTDTLQVELTARVTQKTSTSDYGDAEVTSLMRSVRSLSILCPSKFPCCSGNNSSSRHQNQGHHLQYDTPAYGCTADAFSATSAASESSPGGRHSSSSDKNLPLPCTQMKLTAINGSNERLLEGLPAHFDPSDRQFQQQQRGVSTMPCCQHHRSTSSPAPQKRMAFATFQKSLHRQPRSDDQPSSTPPPSRPTSSSSSSGAKPLARLSNAFSSPSLLNGRAFVETVGSSSPSSSTKSHRRPFSQFFRSITNGGRESSSSPKRDLVAVSEVASSLDSGVGRGRSASPHVIGKPSTSALTRLKSAAELMHESVTRSHRSAPREALPSTDKSGETCAPQLRVSFASQDSKKGGKSLPCSPATVPRNGGGCGGPILPDTLDVRGSQTSLDTLERQKRYKNLKESQHNVTTGTDDDGGNEAGTSSNGTKLEVEQLKTAGRQSPIWQMRPDDNSY